MDDLIAQSNDVAVVGPVQSTDGSRGGTLNSTKGLLELWTLESEGLGPFTNEKLASRHEFVALSLEDPDASSCDELGVDEVPNGGGIPFRVFRDDLLPFRLADRPKLNDELGHAWNRSIEGALRPGLLNPRPQAGEF